MKRGKRKRALPLLLAAVFLFSAGMVLRQQLQYHKIVADSEEAAQLVGLPGGQPVSSPRPDEPEPPPEENMDLAELDLEALRAFNEDIAGWIVIPGTTLSYPLLQGKDNRYYLNHSWKKEISSGGSIFLEQTNSRDLSDFHTIVYGHRMRNDTMFGALKFYKDADFWKEHPSVYLVMNDGVYRYDIFATRKAGVKSIVYRLDIEEKHLEQEFFQSCVENSVIDTGILPEAGDRILTLSTCTGNDYTNRWVVHAVLRRVEAAE